MNEHSDKEHFIGSLIPLPTLLETIRLNKCKCLIAHFHTEEGRKDDLGKKIADIEIT
jgi:hypothetical protein